MGSSACSASTKAAVPPAFWHSAMTSSVRVVLPEDSGPKISTTRPLRQAADAECDIQPQRTGGDDLDVAGRAAVAEAHHGALAELPFNLSESGGEGLFAVFFHDVRSPGVKWNAPG